MDITGQCFCGAIHYEASVDPGRIGICHCRDCQIFSGSAFRTAAVVARGDLRFTRGTPRTFEKTSERGTVRDMAFCGVCGTHLCSLPPGDEDGFVSLRIASSHQFDRLRPVIEIFCDARVAWLAPLEGTFQAPKMPGELA